MATQFKCIKSFSGAQGYFEAGQTYTAGASVVPPFVDVLTELHAEQLLRESPEHFVAVKPMDATDSAPAAGAITQPFTPFGVAPAPLDDATLESILAASTGHGRPLSSDAFAEADANAEVATDDAPDASTEATAEAAPASDKPANGKPKRAKK